MANCLRRSLSHFFIETGSSNPSGKTKVDKMTWSDPNSERCWPECTNFATHYLPTASNAYATLAPSQTCSGQSECASVAPESCDNSSKRSAFSRLGVKLYLLPVCGSVHNRVFVDAKPCNDKSSCQYTCYAHQSVSLSHSQRTRCCDDRSSTLSGWNSGPGIITMSA